MALDVSKIEGLEDRLNSLASRNDDLDRQLEELSRTFRCRRCGRTVPESGRGDHEGLHRATGAIANTDARFPINTLADVNERHVHLEHMMGAAKELTVASSAIRRRGMFHKLAGGGNLDKIAGGRDGMLLYLRASSDSVDQTIRHNQDSGTGNNILISDNASVVLNEEDLILKLLYDGSLDTKGAWIEAGRSAGLIDHGGLGGLGDDDHAIYALLAGRSGGQTLIGGTASGEDLQLQSTANATRGSVRVDLVLRIGTDVDDFFNMTQGASTSQIGFASNDGILFTKASNEWDFQIAAGSVFNISAGGLVVSGGQFVTGSGASFELTFTIESPTSSEDVGIHFFHQACTIQEVNAVVKGSSPSVTIDPMHSTTRNDGTPNDLLSAATAITNEGAGQTLTSFDDATFPADTHLWLVTTAQSGTVDSLELTFRGTFD